jgi:tetratricopeptide (TPR) repeat protein
MTRIAKWSIALGVTMAFCLAVAVAIGCSIHLFREQQQQQSALIEGYQAVRNNDCETAIAKLTEALTRRLAQPAAGEAYANRAYCHAKRGEREQALRDYEESIRLYPKLSWVFAARGFIHLTNGDAEAAFADLSTAIRLDANQVDALQWRARIHFSRRDFADAIEDLKEAARVQPKSADIYADLGEAQFAANDLQRARASLDTAIALDPQHARAYGKRAQIHHLEGRREKAVADSVRAGIAPEAIALNGRAQATGEPHTALGLLHQGILALQSGQHDHAIRSFDTALAMQLDSRTASQAYMNRGNAYLAKRDVGRARSDYEKAISEDPRNAGAHVNRASLSIDDDPDLAIEECTKAIELDPNLGEAYINRGLARDKKRQPAEALVDFKKAVELNSARIEVALNFIAWTRATHPDESLRNANEAIAAGTRLCEQTHWREGTYIDTLAAAYAEKGDFERAVELQMQAAALFPTGAESLRKELESRIELYRGRQPYREER